MTVHQEPAFGYSPNAKFWVKIMQERLDRYRTDLTDAAVLDALRPVDGQTVLDAGCGEGYLSRILAKAGADVTGVDLNAELVEAAIDFEELEPQGISYLMGSITAPLEVRESSFDAVVCNHVLNDIDDIESAFIQVGQALKPGGRFVALVLHPCFYWQRSGLEETDREWPQQYFNLRSRMQSFNVAGIDSPSDIKVWHRPLEDYASALANTGYVITNISEPHPTESDMSDSWWQQNWKRPLFLLISARLQLNGSS